MSQQIELFPLDEIQDRDFYYGDPSHHTTAISTQHKKRRSPKQPQPNHRKESWHPILATCSPSH